MKNCRVAVLGATGAVGREMLKILEEYDFPCEEPLLLASARSAGNARSMRFSDTLIRSPLATKSSSPAPKQNSESRQR